MHPLGLEEEVDVSSLQKENPSHLFCRDDRICCMAGNDLNMHLDFNRPSPILVLNNEFVWQKKKMDFKR